MGSISMEQTKKYRKALVLGKFCPLHKGHVALIEYARSIADETIVLICSEESESIDGWERFEWVRSLDYKPSDLWVDIFEYKEGVDGLVSATESSREVSKVWANKLKEISRYSIIYNDLDVIVSSEKYGDYVAEYMNISHEMFDEERKIFPISSTDIRFDWVANWEYLPDTVKQSLQKTIVVVGTESTGKTTLVNNLLHSYGTDIVSMVSEVGRELVDDSADFEFKMLHTILEKHYKRYQSVRKKLTPFIIMDTDVHTTMSYGIYCFDENPIDMKAYQKNYRVGDMYIYCSPNGIKWEQDGTRMPEKNRNELDRTLRTILRMKNIEYITLEGGYDTRTPKALKQIEKLKQTLIF